MIRTKVTTHWEKPKRWLRITSEKETYVHKRNQTNDYTNWQQAMNDKMKVTAKPLAFLKSAKATANKHEENNSCGDVWWRAAGTR